MLSMLVDGSTNVTAIEQKIIYISCLTETCETSCRSLQMSDVANATVEGFWQNIIEVFQEMGV